jgi:hypothetical protein
MGWLEGQNPAQYMLLYLDTVRIFVTFPETFKMRMIRFKRPGALDFLPGTSTFMKLE